MVDGKASIVISDLDLKAMERKEVATLTGLFTITIPNGAMYDLSIDRHTGNLTISHCGGSQVVVIPHAANTISIKVEPF